MGTCVCAGTMRGWFRGKGNKEMMMTPVPVCWRSVPPASSPFLSPPSCGWPSLVFKRAVTMQDGGGGKGWEEGGR